MAVEEHRASEARAAITCGTDSLTRHEERRGCARSGRLLALQRMAGSSPFCSMLRCIGMAETWCKPDTQFACAIRMLLLASLFSVQ